MAVEQSVNEIIKDTNMVLVKSKSLGNVAVIYDGENFSIPSFVFSANKTMDESEIEKVYFPVKDKGLQELSIKEFKKMYEALAAVA